MQIGNGIRDLLQIGGDVAAHQYAVPLILNELQKQIQQLAAHHGVQTGSGFKKMEFDGETVPAQRPDSASAAYRGCIP